MQSFTEKSGHDIVTVYLLDNIIKAALAAIQMFILVFDFI